MGEENVYANEMLVLPWRKELQQAWLHEMKCGKYGHKRINEENMSILWVKSYAAASSHQRPQPQSVKMLKTWLFRLIAKIEAGTGEAKSLINRRAHNRERRVSWLEM